jgi:hypothetical protein
LEAFARPDNRRSVALWQRGPADAKKWNLISVILVIHRPTTGAIGASLRARSRGEAVTNDVSPYLQRPVRRLEEVIAEAEQQRQEIPSVTPTGQAAGAQKPEAAPPATSTPS